MYKIARFFVIQLIILSLTTSTLAYGQSVQSTQNSQAATDQPQSFTLQTLEMSTNGLILELRLHDFSLVDQHFNGHRYQALSAAEMYPTGAPGEPQIPSISKLIGIPRSGVTSLKILEIETEARPQIRLLPTLPPVEGTPQADALAPVLALPGNDSRNVIMPSAPVTLGLTGKLREQDVAQIIFNPFQYNSIEQELLIHRRIRVAIEFDAAVQADDTVVDGASVASKPQVTETSPFDAVYQSTLLNFDTLHLFKHNPRPAEARSASRDATHRSSGARVKIVIDEPGIYQVPFSWMQSVGLDLTDVDPRNLQVHYQGEEIAIAVKGEEDGRADPSDALIFVADAAADQFSNESVYWLSIADSLGLRIQRRNGTPSRSEDSVSDISTSYYYLQTTKWESNQDYWKDMPVTETADGADADSTTHPNVERHWFWERIQASSTAKEFPFTLNNVLRISDTTTRSRLEGRITIRLHGRTETDANPDHHTIVLLNGREVDDIWWDGQVPLVHQIQVSQNLLLEGENILTISAPGDTEAAVDSIYFDNFEITHWSDQLAHNDQLTFSGAAGPRVFSVGGFSSAAIDVFDLRDPKRVRQIIGGDVWQESINGESSHRIEFLDRVATNGEYLVVEASQKQTPRDIILVEANQSDAALHSPQNQADYVIITHPDLLSAVEPLADLRAAAGLTVKTVDVTQIYDEFGDGTLSPIAIRDFIAYAYHSWQPPAPLYVLLVGDANYDYQDFLETGYANDVPTALFNSPIIGQTPTDNWFVSVSGDDFLPDLFIGRIAASTSAQVDAAIDKILTYESISQPSDWVRQSLFVAEDEANFQHISDQLIEQLPYSYEAARVYGESYPNPPDATPQIIQSIDRGVSLITFIGHGSITDWYWDELVFGLEHIAELKNDSSYPFLITGSCNNGLFAHPTKQISFAEAFVHAENQGGIGVWSPTGLGYTYWHEELIEALFEALFDEGVTELGAATTAAKVNAYAELGWREPVEISTLFGDPALRLRVSQPEVDLRVKPRSEDAFAGEDYEYEIAVVNNGDVPIRDLTVEIAINGGALTEVIPPAAHNNNRLTFAQIEAGSAEQIVLKVSIPADAQVGADLQLTATLFSQNSAIVVRELADFIKDQRLDEPNDGEQNDGSDNDGSDNEPDGESATTIFIPLHVE